MKSIFDFGMGGVYGIQLKIDEFRRKMQYMGVDRTYDAGLDSANRLELSRKIAIL